MIEKEAKKMIYWSLKKMHEHHIRTLSENLKMVTSYAKRRRASRPKVQLFLQTIK